MKKKTEYDNINPVEKLKTSINDFIGRILKNYCPTNQRKRAIHDAVWGTHVYSIPECAIIDSPQISCPHEFQSHHRL